jgi:exodeoxyribonuclease V gamma subunit
LGRLAEAVGLLQALAGTLSESRPIAAWVERFRRACTGLLAASPETAWQMEALERILSEAVEASGPAGAPSGVDLAFSDARRVLDERLDDKVGRADFFRGGITVTSMTPLRWVPFRVVCLLGMDQTAFGSEGSAGDDLTATPPRIGDRDPRGEARESLLEAVLAAGEHLVVVRDGRDVKTNQVVPRAVVTAELFEAVLSVVDPGLRPAVADRLEIDHPRQPFDERCFEVGRLVAGKAWGFDGGELDGALARRRQAVVRPPFLDTPLEPVDTDVIDLADLQRFFNDPVASFFSQRLQARLPREEDELPTILPMGTDGLHGWKIGTRLLEARVAGHTFDQWLRHERATGSLPPGPLGDASVTALGDNVEQLVEAARQSGLESGPGQSVPVDAELPDGTRVVGSVRLRRPSDEPGPVRLFYSRAKATHRVAAWLDLMALLATDPDRPWRSVAVSRAAGPKGGAEVVDLKAGPELVGRAEAAKVLAVAADLYRRGLCEPIPLFPNFSYALYSGYKVSEQWRGYKFPADGDRPAAKLAFGDRDLAAMKAMPALPTDPEGRHPRVMRYATYLYRTISQSTTSGPSATGSRSNTSGARR